MHFGEFVFKVFNLIFLIADVVIWEASIVVDFYGRVEIHFMGCFKDIFELIFGVQIVVKMSFCFLLYFFHNKTNK